MTDKPNIIWIYCDELRTDALECYGNHAARMHTPNIDAIAENGVLFENNFCNSPVCVAARTSTLTGLYPEDTGVYNNEAMRPNYQLDRTYETFPEVFARHGYKTANFGKVHVPSGIHPWMHDEQDGSYMKAFYDDVPRASLDIISVPTFPYIVIGGRYPADRPYPADAVMKNALRWLKDADGPYLARLSFLQPHTPVLPPPPYDTLYADVPFRDRCTDNSRLSFYEKRYAEIVRAHQLSTEEMRRIQIEYYGLVAWLDAQIGLLLDFLESNGLLENTIIVFEADHGASLGEGGRLQKLTYAPEVHRVPRIISWKGTLPAGQRRSDICASIDTGKTLFDLTGVPAPDTFKGRRLFSDDAPDAIYSTIGYGFESSRTFPSSARGQLDEQTGWSRRSCIRTHRYRLDKNVRVNGNLPSLDQTDIFMADTLLDPNETRNIAHLPRYTHIQETLSRKLDEHTSNHFTPPEEYTSGLEELK